MADYGLITLRLPDGRNLKVRGSVSENPVPFTSEPVINHDGSVDRSFTATAYRFTLSLAARDQAGALVDVAALMAAGPLTLALLADKEKASRVYSRAVLTGDPQVDLQTGELSGVNGVAEGRVVMNV